MQIPIDRLPAFIRKKREAEERRHAKRMEEIDKEYWDRFYHKGKYQVA